MPKKQIRVKEGYTFTKREARSIHVLASALAGARQSISSWCIQMQTPQHYLSVRLGVLSEANPEISRTEFSKQDILYQITLLRSQAETMKVQLEGLLADLEALEPIIVNKYPAHIEGEENAAMA